MPGNEFHREAESGADFEREASPVSGGRERLSARQVEANHFSQDVQELIRLFYEFGVRYLLIGGEAVIFHGYPRYTGDVDFYYEPGLENAERLFQALLRFWDGDVPGINSPPDLADPGLVLQFGRPPNRVDLLSRVSGIEFESAWQRRIVTVLGEVELPYLGLEDLVEAKRAAGRPKDLQDLIYLEKLLD